ncbi:SusC/RagA family TonB-linked outer membrane protein [Niastella vici]|uniref:SusC/RagA family TonB-linked outer membrane protein n=1 Tax=Niastella vici TaxID=1703345 RepID=A0A1V9FSC8_9BACT|nr:TonB-dependent receptor [Niastella vici]OQP61201.1 SusC/RagA family TonB-linked outer membrane protein [Niastella vici]
MYLSHCLHRYLRKIKVGRKELIVMNYLTIFLLATCLHLTAGVYSQKVTLSGENISLKQVFKEIKKQTGYTFVYREVLLQKAGKVNVNVKNASVQQVLDICFRNQPLSYTIINNNIVVVKESHVPAVPVVTVEKPVKVETAPPPPVKITGVVLNETGAPLANANVAEKGKLNSVMTRGDGSFAIMVEGPGATLVVSYVGFDDKQVFLGDKTEVSIKMSVAQAPMEEQVVVGYGTSKKATVTGALEPVTSKNFESRAVSNPALALQGSTPGLTITRTSSRPGNEELNMQIRGVTSVNGGSPLIVIDGIPVANTNAFFTMNPDDIESVNVLKDGMAAIFGSRAANGVILVTTKRGKGKTKIDYGYNARINTLGLKTPATTMQQYASMWIDAITQDPKPDYWGWQSMDNLKKMQQGIEGIYSTSKWGDIFIGNANRYDELFATRLSQQHNLSVSGSSDKTSYRLSAAYADNRGPLATAYDGKKQYNLRLNYDYKLTEKVKLQTGVTYQRDITSSPSSGLRFEMIAWDAPLFPAKNPFGLWYANFGVGDRNSTAATMDGGRDTRSNDLVRTDIKATAELLKGLEVEGTVSYQVNQYRMDNYRLTVPTYRWNGAIAEKNINPESDIRAQSDNTLYQNYTGLLRYTKTVGSHRFTAMAGMNAEKNDYKSVYGYRTNIGADGVYDLNVAPTDYVEAKGGRNQWGLYSYIGRLNYGFKGTYLLELVARRDGSSRFAPGNKWSNFYDVSAGWVITNENFIRDLGITDLNYLKIRSGYGVMGNNVNIGDYDYISDIAMGNTIFGSVATSQTTVRLNRNGLTSNDRTWERVKMINVGIDAVMLRNRLTARFDYYKKRNDGMLINILYPAVLGGNAPQTNNGVLDVKGWEAMLGWRDKIGDFSYNVTVNIADSRNKLVALNGAAAYNPGLVAAVEGHPLNSWFMYSTRGFLTDQKMVDLYYDRYTAIAQGEMPAASDDVRLRAGDTRKRDVNGDGIIDQRDVKYMGDAAPHYTFGLTLGAGWKNIDFTAFLQGVGQQYIERTGALAYPFWDIYTNQNSSFLGNTWTPENTGAKYPRLTTNKDRARWNYLHNDFMLQNNRYLRLKSLIVGYTLPQSMISRIKLERVRVYFSGNDLFEFTSIKDGFDPEQGANSQLDGYPFMRTWSFGLNLGL